MKGEMDILSQMTKLFLNVWNGSSMARIRMKIMKILRIM